MFNPFPVEKAHSFCKKFVAQLECGILELVNLGEESVERKNQGIMLGVLVCNDANGNEIILKTVSGIGKRIVPVEGLDLGNEIYVEPIVSYEDIQAALSKNDEEIHALTNEIDSLNKSQDAHVKELIEKRKHLCAESLENVFSLYSFNCADGKKRSLFEICKEYNGGSLPPTGTGDCCAPKLLSYAYGNGLIPVSLCEVFYENGKSSFEIVPPCDERCGILLPAILGLRILYRDEHIIVVNKQSGVLSVPGRGPDKQDCIVNRFRRLFPNAIEQPAVHRLDMETSGILVLAFTKEAHREMNRQFEAGEVQKNYIALIDGVLAKKGIASHGQMELYFRLDIDNRPHQIWDDVYGKKAITEWNILNVEKYKAPDGSLRHVTRVKFIPHTGRTHQLRLASADSHGFGMPIIGDTLYGHCEPGERLMLHAEYLRFTHPFTGKVMEFTCPSEF